MSFFNVVRFISVNLTALIPLLLNDWDNLVKSDLLNAVSKLGSINSYKLSSSTLNPSLLEDFKPSFLISLKTTSSLTMSFSFSVKLLTSPSLTFAYSAA